MISLVGVRGRHTRLRFCSVVSFFVALFSTLFVVARATVPYRTNLVGRTNAVVFMGVRMCMCLFCVCFLLVVVVVETRRLRLAPWLWAGGRGRGRRGCWVWVAGKDGLDRRSFIRHPLGIVCFQ